MTAVINLGWSKPSTILFASEFPANEKAFASVLAQAAESGAELVILHAHDSLDATASVTTGLRHYDYAAACAEKHCLEPLVQRAEDVGIRCTIALREGLAADQILTFLRERKIDRIVMGACSLGPLGKLLVGSVAEAVLRNASVPVCIIGPHVVERSYRNCATRKILCDVSTQEVLGQSRRLLGRLLGVFVRICLLHNSRHWSNSRGWPSGRMDRGSLGRCCGGGRCQRIGR
jgi:nucleotide-binding universal stress UspA family protein